MTEAVCPEGANVLVKVDSLAETTEGGIIVPEIAQQNMQSLCTTGTLVGMGPATTLAYYKDGAEIGVKREDLPLKVLYVRYSGTPVKTGDRRNQVAYRLLTERDITAFLFDDNIITPQGV